MWQRNKEENWFVKVYIWENEENTKEQTENKIKSVTLLPLLYHSLRQWMLDNIKHHGQESIVSRNVVL